MSLVPTDAGTFYVTFMDGSDPASIVSSRYSKLVVNTKTNVGSKLMSSVYFKVISTSLIT